MANVAAWIVSLPSNFVAAFKSLTTAAKISAAGAIISAFVAVPGAIVSAKQAADAEENANDAKSTLENVRASAQAAQASLAEFKRHSEFLEQQAKANARLADAAIQQLQELKSANAENFRPRLSINRPIINELKANNKVTVN